VLASRTSCRALKLDIGGGVGTLKSCVRCGEVVLGAVHIPSVLVNHMGRRRRANSRIKLADVELDARNILDCARVT
jgi:hypothetical protein